MRKKVPQTSSAGLPVFDDHRIEFLTTDRDDVGIFDLDLHAHAADQRPARRTGASAICTFSSRNVP
jgi:hypothetical protein